MSATVSSTQPIRDPDVDSQRLMGRRGWWLVVLNVLIPGSAQMLAGNKRLGRIGLSATLTLWALVVVTVILVLTARSWLLSVALTPWFLIVVQVLLALYAVLFVVLTLDTLRLVRLVRLSGTSRGLVAVLTVVGLVLSVGGASWGSYLAGVAGGGIGSIFSATQSLPAVDGRYNVLLLGGDAGDDREGLRPDSISVVSIDADSGEAVMIGLPRDMLGARFAEGSPMAARYPDGYWNCDVDVCKLNSIYTEAEVWHADYYPDAVANSSSPGIEATKDAAEGITGLTIQYYVLVDMAGFSSLIDALGGVDIEVTERLPIGGDENFNNVDEWIEPGMHHFNGYYAQWYARSRHGTSDYDRMARQKELIAAVVSQFEPVNVLTKFEDVMSAGSDLIKTDVPANQLGFFAELANKTRTHELRTYDLTPENGVDQDNPDIDAIHTAVEAELEATPTP
ncbi:LCP family protein [Mycetocola reblochoni]|uniref:LCP family protein n=1 Tax=Mycetocola reblochoni TaxID=331618 RepID=UPI003F9AC9A2